MMGVKHVLILIELDTIGFRGQITLNNSVAKTTCMVATSQYLRTIVFFSQVTVS
jgi:hypothetical protein